MVLAIDESLIESSSSIHSSPVTPAQSRSIAPAVPFTDVAAPGTYLIRDLGIMVRIPPEGLLAGRSPVIGLVCDRPVMVTRLSENPWLPIGRARSIAADLDLIAHF